MPPPRLRPSHRTRRRPAAMGVAAGVLVLLVVLSRAAASNAERHGVTDTEETEDDFVEEGDELFEGEEEEGDEEGLGEEGEGVLWEEELEEDEDLHLNATGDELEALSAIADFLGNLQVLLSEADHQKERERADRILVDAWGPVQRMADSTAAQAAFTAQVGTARCVVGESKRAREAVDTLRADIEDCYDKAATEWTVEGVGRRTLQQQAEEEEEEDADEAQEVEAEANRFLALGLAILRASPFVAADAVDVLAASDFASSLSAHAEMLVRRGRRRRARLASCVDLQLELAYKRADGARDAIAGCVVQGVLANAKETHDEL